MLVGHLRAAGSLQVGRGRFGPLEGFGFRRRLPQTGRWFALVLGCCLLGWRCAYLVVRASASCCGLPIYWLQLCVGVVGYVEFCGWLVGVLCVVCRLSSMGGSLPEWGTNDFCWFVDVPAAMHGVWDSWVVGWWTVRLARDKSPAGALPSASSSLPCASPDTRHCDPLVVLAFHSDFLFRCLSPARARGRAARFPRVCVPLGSSSSP